MIVADTRFNADEKSVLASLIGKTLEKYRHDEVLDPEHGEDAWGIIGLYADGDAYALTNVRELYNVLGDEDDTPVVHLAKVSSDEIRSHLVGVQQKDWVVGETIKDILLYEDTQIMQEDCADAYKYAFTSAIVFQFERSQLVFEPEGWIMEIFLIHKGQHAEEEIQAAIDGIPEGDRDRVRVERKITSLTSLSVN